MQRANCLVSIGGDHGNTVPKYLCTAAEIAVLREIHGNDAVTEIEPIDDVQRSNREERGRLVAIYGGAKYQDQKPIVDSMFPGVAARVFEKLDELELDESFFKPTGRLQPNSPASPVTLAAVEALDKPSHGEGHDDEDGVGDDMDDEHAEDVGVAGEPVADQTPVTQAPTRTRREAKAAGKRTLKAKPAPKGGKSVFD